MRRAFRARQLKFPLPRPIDGLSWNGLEYWSPTTDADIRGLLAAFVSSDPSFKLVGVAADADEAIELASEHSPDAALLDVAMPGGGGLRVVRELQSFSPDTSVVALSAYDERNIVIDMLQAGAISYLVKGATREQILHALHRSIEAHAKLA